MSLLSPNTIAGNGSLIHRYFPLLGLKNRSFLSDNASQPSIRRGLRSRRPNSVSASATKAAFELEVSNWLSDSITDGWKEFAERVSGEWDGYGADFTTEGKPTELPEAVVPEAFREWGVQVFDWLTQCPTLAETENPVLFYKLIKLLPTVGCEADAATQYTIDERNVGGANNKVYAFAYHRSGSYVAIWLVKDEGAYRVLELEHCLVDPRNHESRVRVVQVVRVEGTVMRLENIKVFSEQWYGPFRNGEQLGGCAIRDSTFASSNALKESEVLRKWEGSNISVNFQSVQAGVICELANDKPQNTVRNKDGIVLLPKQLWCSLKEREDDETLFEVGWLLDCGQSVTSRCVFLKDGQLKGISLGRETAMLEKI
ncbi:hypothetical protein QJS10_CPA03g02461 [Acorus calamus]|uniref:Uncharacterized protein n=1 Tax=Acorus calamus TaxID=4465 RepID=A0AAV9F6D5_ACOCL|nr:hypothetical protein QJS10_CPA03g02461 [Acorus calamus]